MASVFKRGNTWWVAYYYNGRLRRQSLKTKNKRIAEREKQALEAEVIAPSRRAPEDKNPTVVAFWEEYLAGYARSHKRPRSVMRTEVAWRQLMEFTGAQRLGDITKSDIESFKAHRKKRGNADQTVNNALREIKAVYNRAIAMDLFTGVNPVNGVKFYPVPKTMPTFHTEDELGRLLAAAEMRSRMLKRVVLLCAWAGLRKNALTNTRWEWMDFQNSEGPIIHVKRFEGFDIKDHEDRSIPMNGRIHDEFLSGRKETGFIFETSKRSQGKCVYRFEPKKSLIAALAEAGLPTEQPFQRLRHTFGSLLVQKGVSIFKVSKWMGHSSVTVTERHYAGLQAYDAQIDVF